MSYGHDRTEATEEDRGAAAREGAGTVGAAEEVAGGCDEESIAEREERKCFSLFRALIQS